jgi:4-alpha-glucanotransferase
MGNPFSAHYCLEGKSIHLQCYMSATQTPILSTRCSGILLHPISFPGKFGIGDLGYEAHHFIDFLVESKQRLWQILPLGPTGCGNSPYMSYSAMAGNPLLISPERLQHEGLLSGQDFDDLPEMGGDRIDYDRIAQVKLPLLRKAGDRFQQQATPERKDQFQQFCQDKAYWLDDFALFMAIKHEQNGAGWNTWDRGIAKREPDALEQCRQRLSDAIFFEKFLQFEFFRQWSAIKHYANSRNIHIIGDIPIYVAQDSADVWANPQNFCLNQETSEPAMMAGTPPDFFSETGQLWGNPVYNWEYLQQFGFRWWIQRFHAMLDYVDLIRIDHFVGFESFWVVPQGAADARGGRWAKAPGQAFFETLKQELGSLPVLAEDLGTVTAEVEALRNHFGFPGMKILHFAFCADSKSPYLPFNFDRNCVVYTGTHDNDTTVGWYEQLGDQERNNVLTYLGCVSPEGIHWDLIRLALSSIANLAIVPLQDVLGLGTGARMNSPGKQEGNWEWRYQADTLTGETSDRLRHLTQFFDRAPITQT